MDWLTLVLDVLAVVGGSAVIAATPVAKVLSHVPMVKKVVDVIGMNVGEAKNLK